MEGFQFKSQHGRVIIYEFELELTLRFNINHSRWAKRCRTLIGPTFKKFYWCISEVMKWFDICSETQGMCVDLRLWPLNSLLCAGIFGHEHIMCNYQHIPLEIQVKSFDKINKVIV